MFQPTKCTRSNIFRLRKGFLSFVFRAFVVFATLSGIQTSAFAQNLNLTQIQREHLITMGSDVQATGNLSIYVSYPNWFGKPGYCPVRVRVVPRKGMQFKENGQLQVIFGIGSYNPNLSYKPNRQIIVDVPLEAGTSEATGEILGNFINGDQISRFEMQYVYAKLNGRKLRAQNAYFWGGGGANTSECKYLILISTESAKDDSRRLDAIDEMEKTGNWYSQEANVRSVGYSIAYADVRKLPTNWLELSGIGGISIEIEDLVRMDPKGRECINRYVLDGGFLTVNKVGSVSDASQLLPLDVNRQTGKSRTSNNIVVGANSITVASFEPPTLDPLRDTIWDDYQRALGSSYFYIRTQTAPSRSASMGMQGAADPFDAIDQLTKHAVNVGKAALDSEIASACHFASVLYDSLSKPQPQSASEIALPLYLSHGLGTVHLNNKRRSDQSNAFDEMANRTNVNPQNIYAISNRTGRLGGGIGDDFWDWLIPSVGRTPAIPFLIFVILFVGVGAPGVMAWSNRHKRRIWLVILMPFIAALCTIFLFGYGLLKDGFGAVTRSRSLSFIDEKGDGMVWSRQSYFAATVPTQGVELGKETYIAPMLVNPYTTNSTSKQLNVQEGQKYVGLLPARLQTQFSISHPLRNLSVIKRMAEVDSVLKGPAVQNASDFDWTQAVFISAKDEFFVASNTTIGQRASFAPCTRDDAEMILQQEYKRQPLAPPPDSPSADQTTLASTFNIFRVNRTGNSTGQIIEEKVWEAHIGKSRNQVSCLTPGTFIIYAKEAPYLEKCMSNALEQDGLHMIVGRW